jgi:hypothetical protein
MPVDNERNPDEQEVREPEYDWSVYGDHEQSTSSIDGKDILALFIAALQTIFLPLILLGIFLLGLGLVLGIFF